MFLRKIRCLYEQNSVFISIFAQNILVDSAKADFTL